jgi:hypothetical protein
MRMHSGSRSTGALHPGCDRAGPAPRPGPASSADTGRRLLSSLAGFRLSGASPRVVAFPPSLPPGASTVRAAAHQLPYRGQPAAVQGSQRQGVWVGACENRLRLVRSVQSSGSCRSVRRLAGTHSHAPVQRWPCGQRLRPPCLQPAGTCPPDRLILRCEQASQAHLARRRDAAPAPRRASAPPAPPTPGAPAGEKA